MNLEIVHIATELAPLAKVGGLADVIHGLPRALIAKKKHVEVILPKYNTLNLNHIEHLEVIQTDLQSPFGNIDYSNTVWRGFVDGIPVAFIESHAPQRFFDRDMIYGCPDDISRFLYFSLAALAYVQQRKKPPSVIHIHDWHTAPIAPIFRERFPELTTKLIFTIHNLAYQGWCDPAYFQEITGLTCDKLLEGDHYNFLKGGVIYADHVTTVSPNYAHEILTTEISGSLQATFKKYHKKFSGILNGIDFAYWNPETDPWLPSHYSAKTLESKQSVKQQLRQRLSLSNEDCPLVASVMRLVPQKGPDLIKAALLRTLEWGGQFVLLGSAHDEKTKTQFYNLKRTLSGGHHVHLELTYNEELAHLVYAGADLFLVPSLFEPCGLTQMIAMRYGTVPLVRKTGGLADTVFEGRNGFNFEPFTAEGIFEALDRAFATWYENREQWSYLSKNGMQEDFSWNHPALEYLKLYQSD